MQTIWSGQDFSLRVAHILKQSLDINAGRWGLKMLLDYIENAKRELLVNGIKPVWIKMSPNVHEMLANELNKMRGKTRQGTTIFEVSGLRVEIDNECPPWTAYIEGEERSKLL